MRAHWHALQSQLARQSNRLSFQTGFRSICGRRPDLAAFAEPGQVLATLHGAGGPEPKNRMLRALVAEAQMAAPQAEIATVVLLLALWPGLDAIYGRLWRFHRSDPSMLAAELMGRAATGIATMNLAQVTRVAATLLRNIERDIRRDLIADQAKARQQVPFAEETFASERPPSSWQPDPPTSGDVANLLNCLTPTDSRLVLAVAVNGDSQRDAAQRLGLPYEAARKRYQRATDKLRKSLAAGR